MEQMKEYLRNLQTIADAIPALISRMDKEFRYTFVNKSYERWFNVKSEDLIGKYVRDFVGEVVFERALPHFQKALKGEIVSFEQESPYASGTRYIHVVYTPDIHEQTGEVKGIVALVNDISERKKLELALAESNEQRAIELNNLKEEQKIRELFVNTLTHDLRTPLTAAKFTTLILKRKNQENKSTSDLCDRIVKNIDRTENMVQGLLDANRLRAGEGIPIHPKLTNLSSVFISILDDLKNTFGDRFILELEDHQVEANVDPVAIQRIVENLASNAIKYGDAHSPVVIRLKNAGKLVQIDICNQGKVIQESDTARLFNSFHRTQDAEQSSHKGWGIGLAIVKGLAESHGGSVRVESNPKDGTTFSILLPLSS